MRFTIAFSSPSFSSMAWNLFRLVEPCESVPQASNSSERVYSDRVRAPASAQASLRRSYSAWVSRKIIVRSLRDRGVCASCGRAPANRKIWVWTRVVAAQRADADGKPARKAYQERLAKADWAPSIVPTKLRSISTATARCNNSTLITTRYPDFSRARIPSRPDRGPSQMRTRCPTRR